MFALLTKFQSGEGVCKKSLFDFSGFAGLQLEGGVCLQLEGGVCLQLEGGVCLQREGGVCLSWREVFVSDGSQVSVCGWREVFTEKSLRDFFAAPLQCLAAARETHHF
ncbi:hypothetical protein MmiHf6_07930 [Methanimicrococcus hongohii]|uniref:Uncharacterized protein n=1 Tax=Methanimicrococcus hongohii TaxID=3028295 RepID=A0AA96UZD8_9EURY|nr:hypothetical protein MmiHf6_07930 [Methanimicrococcus sp. Hf6]